MASVAGKEVVDEYNVAEVVKMKAMQLSAKLSIPRSQQPRVNQQGQIAKAGKGAREHPGVDAAQYCMVSQDKIISLVKLGKEVDLVVETMIAKKIMINTMNLHEGYRERKVQEDIVKAEKVANAEKHGSKEVASLGIVVTKEEEGFHFLFCKLHKKRPGGVPRSLHRCTK